MDYLLIIILQLLGIGFHVMQKVRELDKLDPHDSLGHVFSLFWNEDKATLIISGLILVTHVVIHFILDYYNSGITKIDNYHNYTFATAIILGYAGQRLIYKAFGKAEAIINSKIDNAK